MKTKQYSRPKNPEKDKNDYSGPECGVDISYADTSSDNNFAENSEIIVRWYSFIGVVS